MGSQQFCLRWNNYQLNMLEVFASLLASESLVDVTLACEGTSIKAHKVVLSACSPFFQDVFINNPCKHPVVILKDVQYNDLRAIIDFMYHGEVNVSQDHLPSLLKSAEALKIKGLAEMSAENHPQVRNIMPSEAAKFDSFNFKNTAIRSLSPGMPSSGKKKRGRPSRVFQPNNTSKESNNQELLNEVNHVQPEETPSLPRPESNLSQNVDDEIDSSVGPEHSLELEEDNHSLDLLTVDDTQLDLPKAERDDINENNFEDDEFLDMAPDSSYEGHYEDNFNDPGSTSQTPIKDTADSQFSHHNSSPDKKNNSTSLSKSGEGAAKRKRRLWTDSDMQTAVGAVLHGGWTTYAASSQFGIPRRTLRYYIEKSCKSSNYAPNHFPRLYDVDGLTLSFT
ncbi:Protein bric-a-brac 2 [Nymphon striatum]|nr:Protein bric-a-brac 2 [Nymphon striatum]